MLPEINVKLKQVLSGIGCAKAILFGSQARGNARRDSDYDILVVMPQDMLVADKISLLLDLRRKFAKEGIDADVIVKSISEVDYFKDKTGSLVKNALAEGIAL